MTTEDDTKVAAYNSIRSRIFSMNGVNSPSSSTYLRKLQESIYTPPLQESSSAKTSSHLQDLSSGTRTVWVNTRSPSGDYINNYPSQQPFYDEPRSLDVNWPQAGWSYQPYYVPPPKVVPEKVKEEFDPEKHKGKFCALATIVFCGVEHTGILFVKNCGHWKLCGYNGDKLAGGSAGSFENLCRDGKLEITTHFILFDAERVVPSEDELEIT